MDSSLASPFLLLLLLPASCTGNSEMLEPEIISPKDGDFITVTLGSPAEINCKAIVQPEFSLLVWKSSRTDFLDKDEKSPVYYKNLSKTGQKAEVSLVIKQVSEEDLATNYSCILRSLSSALQVTIHLRQGSSPSYFWVLVILAVLAVTVTVTTLVVIVRYRQSSSPSYFLVLGVLGVLAVTVTVTTLVYVKMKLYIVLFLRDELGCFSRPSDAKAYDAYLMHYKTPGGAGLNVEDRRLLEELLEQKLGYTLCLYHRDVLPGQAIAKAVLDCIEQSRRLILVPCSPGQNQDQNQDCEAQYGLLSGLHAALVERQIRLVLVQTASSPSESQTDREQDQDPLPEALCLLAQAGHVVTWQGASSHSLSSSFWRQLRYLLPARPRQHRLEPRRSIASHPATLPHL